eukprot:TRINITY_DN19814_c0_g1_i1.p1 TRINITY_DN19814_c0_g1~~TRINITY_DN19814_c0_g1_i1.p1  ORF type:complete len:652 (+),score=162.62 TRINITY_DN19814_c0_g1_i1:230-1957(+)
MEAAVTTAQVVFAQRTRSRYYYKWRLWCVWHKGFEETQRLQGEMRRLQDQNRRLQDEADDATRFKKRVEEDLREMDERYRQMQNERDGLKREADKLRMENEGLADEAREHLRTAERLRREGDEYERMNDARHRDAVQDLRDQLDRYHLENLQLKRQKEEAEKMTRATAMYARQLEADAAPPPSPKKDEKSKTKNYPELGLCLSDTLPRPIKKGNKTQRVKREDGILVIGVRGPAKHAGILPDDFIRGLNGSDTPFLEDFKKLLTGHPPKETMSIAVERDGVFKTFRITPNASKDEPGNVFKRLVKIPGEGGVEIDISRLAAPKGQYYDNAGQLHTLADDDESFHASPRKGGSPSLTGSPVNPVSWGEGPSLRQPSRHDSLRTLKKEKSRGKETSSGMWDVARNNIKRLSTASAADPERESKKSTSASKRKASASPTPRVHSSTTHSAPSKSRQASQSSAPNSPGKSPEPAPAAPPPSTNAPAGGAPRIAVGARVVRNEVHWRYGEQDGGAGSAGTVARVDAPVGWVTVRWDATRTGSTYRWGADQAYDVQLVEKPESPDSALADAASDASRDSHR